MLPSALSDLSLAMALACTAGAATSRTGGYGGGDDDDDGDDDSDHTDAADDDDNNYPPDSWGGGLVAAAAGLAEADDEQRGDGGGTGAGAGAGAGTGSPSPPDSEGKPLFRAVGSVDPDTAHLNAGFGASERARAGEGGGDEDRSGAVGEVGRGGRRAGERSSSSYCKETRARFVSQLGRGRGIGRRRWRRQQQKKVVFDVCSIDPTGTTALVSPF